MPARGECLEGGTQYAGPPPPNQISTPQRYTKQNRVARPADDSTAVGVIYCWVGFCCDTEQQYDERPALLTVLGPMDDVCSIVLLAGY